MRALSVIARLCVFYVILFYYSMYVLERIGGGWLIESTCGWYNSNTLITYIIYIH